jgi:hypothetical protein
MLQRELVTPGAQWNRVMDLRQVAAQVKSLVEYFLE